jgi:hypothetical protein
LPTTTSRCDGSLLLVSVRRGGSPFTPSASTLNSVRRVGRVDRVFPRRQAADVSERKLVLDNTETDDDA